MISFVLSFPPSESNNCPLAVFCLSNLINFCYIPFIALSLILLLPSHLPYHLLTCLFFYNFYLFWLSTGPACSQLHHHRCLFLLGLVWILVSVSVSYITLTFSFSPLLVFLQLIFLAISLTSSQFLLSSFSICNSTFNFSSSSSTSSLFLFPKSILLHVLPDISFSPQISYFLLFHLIVFKQGSVWVDTLKQVVLFQWYSLCTWTSFRFFIWSLLQSRFSLCFLLLGYGPAVSQCAATICS